VKLPLDTPSYWEGLRRIEKLADKSDSIEIDRNHWTLFRMSLRSVGYPIDAYLEIKEAYTQFVLQQYRGDSERGVVQVEPTDYVIDAGAYHGDTALYFAHRSGPMGRVYSFESNPHSLEVMKRNLALNPELSKRVQIAERAVWGESGLTAYVQGDGPPSAVGFEKTARVDGGVLTLTIDDLAAQECLPRVDFIKMDIEGAELPALRGAVRTLRRFRPRLAIAVYHRPTDLLEVPEHIRSLDLGYRLFLRHFSIHFEETVLFAQTDTA
jgi:FkbM family methyltransferase